MLTAGLDVGAKTVKIVVVENGKMVDHVIVPAGRDAQAAVEEAWQQLKTRQQDLKEVVATGSGRKDVKNATGFVSEVAAAAKGGVVMYPEARTVVDVGAEEGRAVKVDAAGKVVDFAINEKCAAGAGAFTEAMARALEVSLEQMGQMSLTATDTVAMNAQCAVFAESELVALLHAKTPKPDMAKAIHNAIAERVVSMVRRVGLADKVVLIGGMARNVGFVDCLNKLLETQVIVLENPELVAAFGAAILGAEDNFSKTDIG